MEKTKVIVCNNSSEYYGYCFGVISLETGKPIEWIDLYSGQCTYDFIEDLKKKNLYSDYMEGPCTLLGGGRPIDIEDGCLFGAVISKAVLEGIKANRNYEVLHTYGMELNDGYNGFIKYAEYEEE